MELGTAGVVKVAETPMTRVGATSRWIAASRALETEGEKPLFKDPGLDPSLVIWGSS